MAKRTLSTFWASTTTRQPAGHPAQFRLSVPRLQASFTGTGDLLAALLLARSSTSSSLATAVEQAVASVQAVLKDTASHAGAAMSPTEKSSAVMKARELRLIQNQAAITSPQVKHTVEALR